MPARLGSAASRFGGMSRAYLGSTLVWQAQQDIPVHPAFDIMSLSPALLLDAREVAGSGQAQPASGTTVASWQDLSGNARHATDGGTAARRPTFRAAGINGHPALEFDGTNHFLGVTGLAAVAQPITLYMVARPTVETLAQSRPFGAIYKEGHNAWMAFAGAGLWHRNHTTSTARADIVTAVFNGATSKIVASGLAYSGDAGTGQVSYSNVGASSATWERFAGMIAFCAAFPVAHDDATRAQVESYLSGSFDIALA